MRTKKTLDVGVNMARGGKLPAYQTSGSAGFDLAASIRIVVQPGQVALVPTGLILAIPKGYFLGIFARSSLPLKRGLLVANGVGVLDSDYRGANDEVKVMVLNFTQTPVVIEEGERVAQGVILPVFHAEFLQFTPHDESRGGFGSTGQ